MFLKKLTAGVLLSLLASCSRWPEDRITRCAPPATRPLIETSVDGRLQSTTLSVLIYNVEGLPWPARRGRGPSLDSIGEQLARMRRQGDHPDVVLLQEVFTARGARVGTAAAYSNRIRGPSAKDVFGEAVVPATHAAERRLLKGERSGKILNSGLYVLSDYPVLAVQHRGFSRHACAGFDCLAAKGVMLVRVGIPGVPTPVDIMTTHMNAKGRAGVSLDRTLAAHRFQTIESVRFLKDTRDPTSPLIMGGDFNMRNSPDRFDHFANMQPYAIVSQWCTERPGACDVRLSWDGDAPWLDTQDLQAFDRGTLVDIRPERVEALFDGPETGGKLSDHDGYLVTYRLTWATDTAPGPGARVCRTTADGRSDQ